MPVTSIWKKCFIRRKKLCLLSFSLAGLFLFILISIWDRCLFDKSVPPYEWNPSARDPRFVSVYLDRVATSEDRHAKKLILLWTPFFTSLVWDAHHNVFQDCPVSTCEVTTNHHHLTESNAVLFNVRDLSEHIDDPLPPTRTADQVWILHNTEPPYYIYLPLQKYAGVFNWTSWYRRDATIYSPYGQWRELTLKEKLEIKDEKHFHNKSKMVLWVSSNCNDHCHRMKFVTELQKYIHIDTYGKCGTHTCKQNCREVYDDYKFFLSFENGYCRDYITEKFWRPVIRNQIPVVRGGAAYEVLAPPGSYINTDDFPDIPTLAGYLMKVALNESLYNSYFTWKQHYRLVPNGWTRMNWCGLCERLHDYSQPPQTYTDLKGWVQQDTCGLPCQHGQGR